MTGANEKYTTNAMCMFMYLFVVYFSFTPVTSTITHLYCELFYIQVLTMVIITETVTSTSHHDIFTYLDYIFSCYLHTVGFYPYLLSYIYIYIYILLRTDFHWNCENRHVTGIKEYIYKIARMSQGSIKKGWTMGREFLQYKTYGKSQQNKRQTLTKPTQHNLKI